MKWVLLVIDWHMILVNIAYLKGFRFPLLKWWVLNHFTLTWLQLATPSWLRPMTWPHFIHPLWHVIFMTVLKTNQQPGDDRPFTLSDSTQRECLSLPSSEHPSWIFHPTPPWDRLVCSKGVTLTVSSHPAKGGCDTRVHISHFLFRANLKRWRVLCLQSCLHLKWWEWGQNNFPPKRRLSYFTTPVFELSFAVASCSPVFLLSVWASNRLCVKVWTQDPCFHICTQNTDFAVFV